MRFAHAGKGMWRNSKCYEENIFYIRSKKKGCPIKDSPLSLPALDIVVLGKLLHGSFVEYGIFAFALLSAVIIQQ